MSDYKIPSFLKKDGDALVYDGEGEFQFITNEDYWTTKNAFLVGDLVNIIGILDYTIVDSKGKNNGLHPFKFPTVMLTRPSSIEKLKQVKLIKTAPIDDYRVLHYKKGDQVIVSVKVPQDIQNVEDIMKLFLISGHIPTTIPYDKIQDYFPESIKINGANFGVDLNLFGIMISELCRNKNNLEQPFRVSKNNNMLDYKTISIKELPKLISPFDSLISENWDRSAIGACLTKDKQTNSPLQRILTGSY